MSHFTYTSCNQKCIMGNQYFSQCNFAFFSVLHAGITACVRAVRTRHFQMKKGLERGVLNTPHFRPYLYAVHIHTALKRNSECVMHFVGEYTNLFANL